jgi:hypothetical protein
MSPGRAALVVNPALLGGFAGESGRIALARQGRRGLRRGLDGFIQTWSRRFGKQARNLLIKADWAMTRRPAQAGSGTMSNTGRYYPWRWER